MYYDYYGGDTTALAVRRCDVSVPGYHANRTKTDRSHTAPSRAHGPRILKVAGCVPSTTPLRRDLRVRVQERSER